jgi:hypothetical protein
MQVHQVVLFLCLPAECGGLAARAAAIMQLLKLAAASNRVLLVESNHIIPLQQLLTPALINWAMDGIPDLKIPEQLDRQQQGTWW